MIGTVFQSNMAERGQRFSFVRHAVEVLCQHHVFERREIGNQMKLLEDEANLLRAKAVQLRCGHSGDIRAVDQNFA